MGTSSVSFSAGSPRLPSLIQMSDSSPQAAMRYQHVAANRDRLIAERLSQFPELAIP